MRTIYRAGGFGRLVYSEGEYYHHVTAPIDSYKGWRIGSPPLWYPTHSTAFDVGVTGQRFTSVSCMGFKGTSAVHGPGGNVYQNPFADEIAMFETSEGGVSRMLMSMSVARLINETGRVFGERGRMAGMQYWGEMEESLPDISRPPLAPGVPAGGARRFARAADARVYHRDPGRPRALGEYRRGAGDDHPGDRRPRIRVAGRRAPEDSPIRAAHGVIRGRDLGRNSCYLCNLFSKTVGRTFHHYLDDLQLARAKQLLEKAMGSDPYC